MASRVRNATGTETPSERFERVVKKAMARGRRAEEKKNGTAGRHERSIASRSKDLN